MRKALAFLLVFARIRLRMGQPAFHDDTLRANQPGPAQTFSFWRALVS